MPRETTGRNPDVKRPTRDQIAKAHRAARANQRCIASRLADGACSTGRGRCHSVSKRAALNCIAREGKVYTLSATMDALGRSGGPEVVSRGVQQASTFEGLCTRHDTSLFRTIDSPQSLITREAALQHYYRALCHEIYKKERSIRFVEELYSLIELDGMTEGLRRGSAWAVLALMEQLERCERALITGNVSEFCYEAFLSTSRPFIVSSGVWFPDRDFHAKELQRVPQFEHLPACVGVFCLPAATGSSMLFVWHRESSWCIDRLFHSLATKYPPADMGDALIKMAILICENVYFSPDWWDSRRSEDVSQHLSAWRDVTDIRVPVRDNHLLALEGLSVAWAVDVVEAVRSAA